MPVEQSRQLTNPHVSPERIEEINGKITGLWELLPSEHQAALALVLLNGLMGGEEWPGLMEAMAQQWPLDTELLSTAFVLVNITREDLVQVHFNEEEIEKLTDDDLKTIAQTMRDHYVHDVFWPELEYVTAAVLEKKQQRRIQQRLEDAAADDTPFNTWMSQIDRQVWLLAGCSVYDLPDSNFRLMFADGVTPVEAANTVLSEAGFGLLE